MELEVIFMFFITFVLSISIITMLAACVCCRKSVPKNELMGLEGMVKLKNPDHNSSNDIIAISTDPKSNDTEAKRSSTAPHRSLPDIPISEPPGDTGSYDLYATVGDKAAEKPQGRSPSTSMKKLASVSQHSSISQADDVSSPYARVRSPPHAYDIIKSSNNDALATNRRDSDQSLSNEDEEQPGPMQQIHTVSAASAIAGRISASQELPYMTLPIAPPQQHFSGDSQDSSKGYTSISVREPLANIIAQTNQQISHARRRELIDSHYATVSDDSDEMYAAIEDPNNQGDVYTSGSETYAQIQPHVSLTVATEINNIPSTSKATDDAVKLEKSPAVDLSPQRHSITSSSHHDESHLPPPVENLRSVHSRQASSSSSVGNLGSPKPEKRQANSPLPPTPTPKSTHYLNNTNLTNTSSVPSGRNSAASVIEVQPIGNTSRQVSRENLSIDPKKHNDDFVRKKGHIEDLYTKVMKKNKLSNAPSQNTSPVPYRKSFQDIVSRPSLFLSDPDNNLDEDALSTRSIVPNDRNSTAFVGTTLRNDYETIDKRRQRGSNYDDQKDHGYETIPATGSNQNPVVDDGVEQHRTRSSAPAGGNITMLSSTSLLLGNCIFNRNNTVATQQGMKTYWLCKSYRITMCRARCITHQGRVVSATGVYNHQPHMKGPPTSNPNEFSNPNQSTSSSGLNSSLRLGTTVNQSPQHNVLPQNTTQPQLHQPQLQQQQPQNHHHHHHHQTTQQQQQQQQQHPQHHHQSTLLHSPSQLSQPPQQSHHQSSQAVIHNMMHNVLSQNSLMQLSNIAPILNPLQHHSSQLPHIHPPSSLQITPILNSTHQHNIQSPTTSPRLGHTHQQQHSPNIQQAHPMTPNNNTNSNMSIVVTSSTVTPSSASPNEESFGKIGGNLSNVSQENTVVVSQSNIISSISISPTQPTFKMEHI